MKNRVTVTIADQQYTLIADQEADAVQKIAAHVDTRVREVLQGSHLSMADSAILASMNIAEELFKEMDANENLRRQIKENLEEANRLKLELSEAKREIFKLQTRK